jgi:hypothetical protein
VTRHIRDWRIAPLWLGVIFAVALWAPIPVAPNAARAEVVAQVEQRFPGWRINRTRSSWEGAWSVVLSCRGRRVGFQLVPGHGLPAGAAWLHPEDTYSRIRLSSISDDETYLVWYDDKLRAPSLGCQPALANSQAERRIHRLD